MTSYSWKLERHIWKRVCNLAIEKNCIRHKKEITELTGDLEKWKHLDADKSINQQTCQPFKYFSTGIITLNIKAAMMENKQLDYGILKSKY